MPKLYRVEFFDKSQTLNIFTKTEAKKQQKLFQKYGYEKGKVVGINVSNKDYKKYFLNLVPCR
jgi:hypothetical protein